MSIMHILTIVLFAVLAIVKGEFFGAGPNFVFDGSLDPNFNGGRDSRADRGPVVFPPAPPDNGETSGVIPGASGYGFVPTANGQNFGGFKPYYL
ncbi:uncharacterized protein LOC108741696 [Agrilus planipennis]|uniref:Uncharacterized protein LOC108741696 n=1 Tax=Agrilus planipennis TaxID=224129 RepID=A0A1W4X7S0_AGRPL|nr:uncharacterized protein LOC108741696 [Agrilus planipennis]